MAVQVYVVVALMASACALIAPMKKPDGTVDLESVHTHILLLEQMFASLAKASEVETLKSKVRTLKSETRRQIQAVNATVMETRSAVQEAKVYSNRSNVAFEVSNEKAGHTVQASQIFKFDTVTLNNGGGYHAPTGVFEAPVSGTYLFWASIAPKKHIHVALYKEGTEMAVSHASHTSSLTYATEVKRGEKVWFQSLYYASEIWHGRHSTYGGALIHEHRV